MPAVKIATCCYCGTRAALVLKGQTRRELACGTCGAPLRRLKMLRTKDARVTAPAATPTHPTLRKPANDPVRTRKNRPKKTSKIIRLARDVFEEVWDEIEDFFD